MISRAEDYPVSGQFITFNFALGYEASHLAGAKVKSFRGFLYAVHPLLQAKDDSVSPHFLAFDVTFLQQAPYLFLAKA